MNTIEELLDEAREAYNQYLREVAKEGRPRPVQVAGTPPGSRNFPSTDNRFWFVQSLIEFERTVSTITVHLIIGPELYIQAYLSELSGRLSLALVDPSGRLYGRDRERGAWHQHPFDNPD